MAARKMEAPLRRTAEPAAVRFAVAQVEPTCPKPKRGAASLRPPLPIVAAGQRESRNRAQGPTGRARRTAPACLPNRANPICRPFLPAQESPQFVQIWLRVV